jgi:hypothetical protein
MNQARRSSDVVGELLRAMAETVTDYHPSVGRTGSTVAGMIQGTACFPGGSGLWRGKENGGPLPDCFSENPVMFVGHNFDSERGYAISLARGGEAEGDFWTRLIWILEAAPLTPDACFFTNVLMGLKPAKAEGDMPSVPGYCEQCRRFLTRQVEIVRPRAVVALGSQSANYVSELNRRSLMSAGVKLSEYASGPGKLGRWCRSVMRRVVFLHLSGVPPLTLEPGRPSH